MEPEPYRDREKNTAPKRVMIAIVKPGQPTIAYRLPLGDVDLFVTRWDGMYELPVGRRA